MQIREIIFINVFQNKDFETFVLYIFIQVLRWEAACLLDGLVFGGLVQKV